MDGASTALLLEAGLPGAALVARHSCPGGGLVSYSPILLPDGDLGAVFEVRRALDHHPLAAGEAGEHRHVVAGGRPEPDRPPLDLAPFDHEDHVPVAVLA